MMYLMVKMSQLTTAIRIIIFKDGLKILSMAGGGLYMIYDNIIYNHPRLLFR